MELGLSYDDVLLKPHYSPILSRKDVDLRSYLTRGIRLNIPIVAANMDTVCEANMAIAMALNGGIGIIHRFLTIDQQVEEVLKTKRYQSIKIESPYVVYQQQTLKEVKEVISQTGVTGFLVVDHMDKLVGVLSNRDMQFEEDENKKVNELMTLREKLVTAPFSISIEEAKMLLKKHKIEKLPLVNEDNKIIGLITSKDILKKLQFPHASKDGKGRLLVGAAIGVKQDRLQRAIALAKAGVDVIVIDIAHGHSLMVLDTLNEIRQYLGNVQIIAGNVATKEGALALIQAGADAVKVGVGPGSICTTRIVAGSGVPQITSIIEASKIAKEHNVPMIADGGIKGSGDIVKALAAGASTVMIGNLLAGTDESPGAIITKDGKRFKIYRGMAGFGATSARIQKEQKDSNNTLMDPNLNDTVPEGVEGVIPYRGTVQEVLHKLIGGLRSGMSYGGARNIQELQEKAEFIRITQAGMRESQSHDVFKI